MLGGLKMLEMKQECLNCGAALVMDSDAIICSYECTYCLLCAESLSYVCNNCSGELVARPKRQMPQ